MPIPVSVTTKSTRSPSSGAWRTVEAHPTLVAELHGVADEVAEDLGDPARDRPRSVSRQTGVEHALELEADRLRPWPAGFGDTVDDLRRAGRGPQRPGRWPTSRREKSRMSSINAPRRSPDRRMLRVRSRWTSSSSGALEDLARSEHRRQRGPELVARRCQERGLRPGRLQRGVARVLELAKRVLLRTDETRHPDERQQGQDRGAHQEGQTAGGTRPAGGRRTPARAAPGGARSRPRAGTAAVRRAGLTEEGTGGIARSRHTLQAINAGAAIQAASIRLAAAPSGASR